MYFEPMSDPPHQNSTLLSPCRKIAANHGHSPLSASVPPTTRPICIYICMERKNMCQMCFHISKTCVKFLSFLSYRLIFLVVHTVSHQPGYYLFRLIVQQTKSMDSVVEILLELVKEYQMLGASL